MPYVTPYFTTVAATHQMSGLMDIWGLIGSDFAGTGSASALASLGQVLMIDILLAGDNAIVVGALAAGLPPSQRRKVILIGIIAALLLRIGFALAVTQLMQIVGLILAGGLLLLWVSWKMWRELHPERGTINAAAPCDINPSGVRPARSFARAAWAVAIADVSMSLDNVLAVAGAAREHPGIMVIGLIFSVALMGIAANLIAHYIDRFRWIAYGGLAVILYVSILMIHEGIVDRKVGILQLSCESI